MDDPEGTDEEARRLLALRIKTASLRVAMAAFVRGEPPSPEGADNNGPPEQLWMRPCHRQPGAAGVTERVKSIRSPA